MAPKSPLDSDRRASSSALGSSSPTQPHPQPQSQPQSALQPSSPAKTATDGASSAQDDPDMRTFHIDVPSLQPPAAARPKDEKKASSAELEWMTQAHTGTTLDGLGRRRSPATMSGHGRSQGHSRAGSTAASAAATASSAGAAASAGSANGATNGGSAAASGATDPAKSLKDTALEWQRYYEDHKEHILQHDPFPTSAHIGGREKVP